MPLTIARRKSTAALTITGIVAGQRIRRRAASDDIGLAREEAAALEAEILRTKWHGARRGARTFAQAALSYIEAEPRSPHTLDWVKRLLLALGPETKLSQIDQAAATRLRGTVLRPSAKPATYHRQVVTPLRAILHHAAKLGWCDPPHIATPKTSAGRTHYLLPDEADRLVAAGAPHLKPLLIFLLGTGARLGEAIALEWRDVDLVGARVIFWKTKSGKRRDAALSPSAVVALANLPHRDGRVFHYIRGVYADHGGCYGGHIKTAWKGAIRRAGLDPELTPHDLRHTWASWQYALNRDLLGLKVEGGWSSVVLCERYCHLLPDGHISAIKRFLGHPWDTAADAAAATA